MERRREIAGMPPATVKTPENGMPPAAVKIEEMDMLPAAKNAHERHAG